MVRDHEVELVMVKALLMVSLCQGWWTKLKGKPKGEEGGREVQVQASRPAEREVEDGLEQTEGIFQGEETADDVLMAVAII